MDGSELLDRLKRFDSVPMDVEVELHRLNMSVRELLSLEAGSVLRTGKRHGDPLNLRVGGVSLLSAQITESRGKATLRGVPSAGKQRQ